ncbi:uncharacterized protein LOC135076533 isoform X1 [Ostrinia nubilalis]|uniref:uncharacterized protein LOC135076533 isoform X1 n=1 Tax=Ostrinia nubilalis TaxID=29057 RepID=UPI0030823E6D
MYLIMYMLIMILNVIAFSIQNHNNSEGINAILDQLIKQTEGENEGTKGTQFDVKENTGNDSKIIYIKTNLKLTLPNIIFTNITGDPKDSDNLKYDTVSEEIVVEIETQPQKEVDDFNGEEHLKKDANAHQLRSAYPDDYLHNDLLPERKSTLDSYLPKIQSEPDLRSLYPDMMLDPNSNTNSDKIVGTVKEMAKDLMENKDQFYGGPYAPESKLNTPAPASNINKPFINDKEFNDDLLLSGLLHNKDAPNKMFDNIFGSLDNPNKNLVKDNLPELESGQITRNAYLENFADNIAAINLQNALKQNMVYQHYMNNPPPIEMPMVYSLANYEPQPKKVIRTVINHQAPAMPFAPIPIQTGSQCCTNY